MLIFEKNKFLDLPKKIFRRLVNRTPRRSFYPVSATCQIPNYAEKLVAIFGKRKEGFFVEVGAFDGESYSNTSCLADIGWRGLYLEPIPSFAARCRERHKRNIRVQVVELAVSDSNGFEELHVGDAYTTMNESTADAYSRLSWAEPHFKGQRVKVRTSTLDKILEDIGVPPRFELLVVDVEGAEEKVFRGFDIKHWQPQCIIVELIDKHGDFVHFPELRTSASRVRNGIIAGLYKETYADGINTIFVRTA